MNKYEPHNFRYFGNEQNINKSSIKLSSGSLHLLLPPPPLRGTLVLGLIAEIENWVKTIKLYSQVITHNSN